MIESKKLKEVLVRELGIGNLLPQDRDEIVASLGESVLKNIMMKVLETLPESAQAEFGAVSESGDPDKLQIFLKEKISNLDELIQGAIKEVVDRYKELAGVK